MARNHSSMPSAEVGEAGMLKPAFSALASSLLIAVATMRSSIESALRAKSTACFSLGSIVAEIRSVSARLVS